MKTNFENHIVFQKDRVTIYFVDLQIPKREITALEAVLSSEEKSRAKRFRFPRDADRYIVKHAVLRLLLSGYVGCEPCQVDIRTGANGKPYLVCKDCVDVHFNVSSSDAIAVFAFNQNDELGVDIEKINSLPEMLEIVERHFTHREKLKFFSCPDNLRLSLFYKFWTRKEAVLKAQGEGLLRSLDGVDVSSIYDSYEHKREQVNITKANNSDKYFVEDIDGPTGYAVALAMAGPIPGISVKQTSELFPGRYK